MHIYIICETGYEGEASENVTTFMTLTSSKVNKYKNNDLPFPIFHLTQTFEQINNVQN